MSEPSPYTIREYEPGDEVAILEGFNRVFAGVDPTFRPRSLEEWRWLFLGNPLGWRIYLCFNEAGEMVSQYAGTPIPVRLQGEPAHFIQVVDSFTDPKRARGLRRPGPFVVTSYPWAENYWGAPPELAPIVYGLPVRAAWRIGKKYTDSKMVRVQHKLTAPLERVDVSVFGAASGVEVQELERFPEDLGPLTERMAERSAAVTDRTAEHLNWRYADRPASPYHLAVARPAGGGAPLGLAVFRRGDFDGVQDEGLVADWAVAPGDPREDATRAALLAWLTETARAAGCERLVSVFPDTADDWLAFQRAGFRVEPSRYFVVGRHFPRKLTMSWLRMNWYYTLGDTDLV